MQTIGIVFIYLATNEREMKIEEIIARNFMKCKKEDIVIVHIHEDEFNFTYSKSFIKENDEVREYTQNDRKRLQKMPYVQYPTIFRNKRVDFTDIKPGDKFDVDGIMYAMTENGIKDENDNIVDLQIQLSVVKNTD